ncbi:MAG TPA: NAD-glutamate dehydrogenase [Rhizomicrobium sp.]|jgi:glutamate dehydrogenase|nr:NAD-glutamate dehydrogenase [Rhizomicrobium sp.]
MSLAPSDDSAHVTRKNEADAVERIAAGAKRAKAGDERAFYDALFGRAAPDDVNRYTPESLATLARIVHARVQAFGDAHCDVTLVTPRDDDAAYGENDSVLIAINDDKPFLVDSLIADVTATGGRLRAVFHPIVKQTDRALSVIVLVLEPVVSEVRRAALVHSAKQTFHQVSVAVRDWRAMMARLHESIAQLKAHPPKVAADELAESIALLEWLGANHFTFLGARDYTFDPKGDGALVPVAETGLGVLNDPDARVIRRGPDRTALTPQVRAFLTQPSPLIITKSNERSLVHRRVHMDYVGVKTFDAAGTLTGERRFVGLFTSGAYSRRPSDIPLLRKKVAHVAERAGLPPASHDGKALAHILDTYPRDELFQISEDELFETAQGILRLGERPTVRVFLRFDRFDRFVSALVFVPRDRYDTQARERIHEILAKALNGRLSAATPTIDDSVLARVHYIIGREEGARPQVSVQALEEQIRACIRTWDDGFIEAMDQIHGEIEGQRLAAERQAHFSAGYRGSFSPMEAVHDLDAIAKLAKEAKGLRLTACVYRRHADAHDALRLKLYIMGEVMPLSASLPIFENLGLKVIAEDAFPLTLKTGDGWTHEASVLDFQMERADEGPADLATIKEPLENAFHAVIAGQAESDGFNRLVMGAGLAWRDVTILRTVAKFLRQAGFSFSQDYVEQALFRNPDLAGLLVELFHAKNDPADGRETADAVAKRIDGALNDVQSLDDDRIIRRLRNVIDNVLRTNFYQHDAAGASKPYVAIKLDSQALDELPLPRPHVEIFVYSPEVEGVHLRFGKVARGGIRWSDRREDFRTEILGLVKAQQVKNAVIVPVGAKGGFYPKQLPLNATREVVQEAGIGAYKVLINALLDVTDNLHADGKIEPPPNVLRHDGDDPYLVVAADKGTATFSDIANGIAEGRGFWLGDAFASGGSHGYDHKKMGITARGAWEAVKRHFRELGRDIQKEPFTAIGVGDMSGDVFGNGMLLSQETRLLAAFDHRHIFIDPDPDAAKSWAERKRMFDLPRSSWADYDKSLISKGGGIFPRTLKEIPLTPEMKAVAGVTDDKLSPQALMKALLKAEVDLLFFGGIGTYLKAASQSNLDVGDRANDAIRINGGELRAKVVGEGANLGATQLGRIEYARTGGRINTDAIDNSAGVDTSDHEVNLKILLGSPQRRGELTPEARDDLLNAMTDDVAAHVLKDNYDQTLALSVAQGRAFKDLDAHGRYMRDLERRGRLDRAVEFLPADSELQKMENETRGLTRPELAVLLAYAKLDLDAEIVASDLPDDPTFASVLAGYFPDAAVKRFPNALEQHRLRREIISTSLANRLVNLAGPVFVSRMKEMSGASGAHVARAFVVAEGAFGLSALRSRIDALDGKVDAGIQTSMYTDIAEILRRLGLWFITNVPANADLASTIALYRAGVESLRGTFNTLVSPYEASDTEGHIEHLTKAGVPLDVAEDVAVLPLMSGAPEIAQLARARGLPVDLVAGAYFAMGATVGIDRLRGLAARIAATEHWDRLAIRRIADDLFAGQRALTAEALDAAKAEGTRADGAAAVAKWAQTRGETLERAKSFLEALERSGDLSIAKLTLANSQIRELAAR